MAGFTRNSLIICQQLLVLLAEMSLAGWLLSSSLLNRCSCSRLLIRKALLVHLRIMLVSTNCYLPCKLQYPVDIGETLSIAASTTRWYRSRLCRLPQCILLALIPMTKNCQPATFASLSLQHELRSRSRDLVLPIHSRLSRWLFDDSIQWLNDKSAQTHSFNS